MAFQEVQSLDADTVYALGKKDKKTGKPYPKQAEGYYLGSRKVENKRGESMIHFLQTPKGNVGLWGTTDLNRKIGQVPAGTMIRVTSTGTKATPNGDMYTYKVETDSDNTIEVSAVSENSNASYTDDSSSEDSVEENDDYSNAEEQEAPIALSAAERKAKVDALLGKRKQA